MSDTRSRVTTHVLDAVSGRPAAGVAVTLEHQSGAGWQLVTTGVTDEDGDLDELRVTLLPPSGKADAAARATVDASLRSPH